MTFLFESGCMYVSSSVGFVQYMCKMKCIRMGAIVSTLIEILALCFL